MKKNNVFLVAALAFCTIARSQSDTILHKGTNHAVSLDLHAPVGSFSKSHFGGAGLNYSWSHHRFGQDIHAKLIGIIFNGGGDYYFGKRVSFSGNPFHYDGYIYLYATAGIMTNTGENGNISLAAGPALGIYESNSNMGWTARLFGTYYFKDNIAIGPGVTYKNQDKETNALWTVALRVSYRF